MQQQKTDPLRDYFLFSIFPIYRQRSRSNIRCVQQRKQFSKRLLILQYNSSFPLIPWWI